ncbi:unnamed protein product [Ambrosiozyma monospora]|uniref:Unnamed protein product n=1 Tax=Ambrosiozyma monospora TaxID=43982 RepID=A0ACB5U3D0_AMBMO|nr:unnamed protein product [Ambrosiozyma monospora]
MVKTSKRSLFKRVAIPLGLSLVTLASLFCYTAQQQQQQQLSISQLPGFISDTIQQGTAAISNEVDTNDKHIPSVNKNNRKGPVKIKVNELQDSPELQEHLLKLGLTPNHSIHVQQLDPVSGETYSSKKLHGRFLHITDMHPDELNVIGADISEQCHRKHKHTPKDEKSHVFGDAMSGCDSPMDLYRDTLSWIKENLKDHIDFVVWTGDNIRHDNDRLNPRTEMDIFDMNRQVADLFTETFMDDDEDDVMPIDRRVSVVPSLGNNDVYPHNLFAPGPTLQTREMFQIWRNFVPSEQMHVFDRGVYFFKEVIPGELAVLSINTLYFFNKNPLNDNCDSRKQPGYKLFEWLGYTLKELRKRNIKCLVT